MKINLYLCLVVAAGSATAQTPKPKPAPTPTSGSIGFLEPTMPPTPNIEEDQPNEIIGFLCYFFPRWCRRRPPPPPPTNHPTHAPTPPPTPRRPCPIPACQDPCELCQPDEECIRGPPSTFEFNRQTCPGCPTLEQCIPPPPSLSGPYTPAFDHAIAAGLIHTDDEAAPGAKGKALFRIMQGETNVQKSNYNWRSFKITNTGEKRIAAVFIDVTKAIIQDVVFDDDGSGGDDVAKPLTHDWGTTETKPIPIDAYQWKWLPVRDDPHYSPSAAFDSSKLDDVNNLFVDELSDSGLGAAGGYNGELILFDEFDPIEFYEFSGDMDPNSIAGLKQGTSNIHAGWDVGGVSGAEMVNSVVTILFGDGSIASGTLASDGSQAGAVAAISDDLAAAPGLSVDGTSAPATGTYSSTNPTSIIVSANPGDRVLVSMVSAFQPMNSFDVVLAGGAIVAKDLVEARLAAQYPFFPVTNAESWQHTYVDIPASGNADVGGYFSYGDDFALGFTAVVVDSAGVPTSMTAAPIRLLAV